MICIDQNTLDIIHKVFKNNYANCDDIILQVEPWSTWWHPE